MPRQLKESPLTTPVARSRLPAGVHWRGVDVDIHLGFRKRKRGEGTWLVRWYKGNRKYWHREFGIADGAQEADGVRVLHFSDAKRIAFALVDGEKAKVIAEMQEPAVTVKSAVEAYIADLERRQRKKGVVSKNQPGGPLVKHVLSDAEFSVLPLYELMTDDLRDWKERLEKGRTAQGKPYAASTIERVTTDFKAALNLAAVTHRDRLPADFQVRIKDGLGTTTTAAPIPRHGQALSDDAIRKIIAAAAEVDAEEQFDGDLYRLTVLQAATGTRFSQLIRIRVADLQPQYKRVMIPVSFKGRGEKAITHVAFPVDDEVIEILKPLTNGRHGDEFLFERWFFAHKRVDGVKTKVRVRRGPWGSNSNFTRLWNAIAKKADVAGQSGRVVAYALRHSSIVRMLRLEYPTSLVAALHDTSDKSIRQHYAAEIVDALSDLVSKGALRISASSPSGAESASWPGVGRDVAKAGNLFCPNGTG